METQTELTAQLTEIAVKVEKVGVETRTLLTKIEALQDALENQGNVTPELQAAADALAVQVEIVDNLVPDEPTPPPA